MANPPVVSECTCPPGYPMERGIEGMTTFHAPPCRYAIRKNNTDRVHRNRITGYSNDQLRESLGNWANLEQDKVTDSRGYGSDDRRTFQYRADLLTVTIERLTELEALSTSSNQEDTDGN